VGVGVYVAAFAAFAADRAGFWTLGFTAAFVFAGFFPRARFFIERNLQ
jgi:hypothetical protein